MANGRMVPRPTCPVPTPGGAHRSGPFGVTRQPTGHVPHPMECQHIGLGGERTMKAWLGTAAGSVFFVGLMATPSLAAGYTHIDGTAGDDRIVGTAGRDWVDARGGDDTVKGRDGRDILEGRRGDDILRGGKAGDSLYGNRGADILYGGRGHDILSSGYGGDVLRGGRGADRFAPGGGADVAFGGPGADTFFIQKDGKSDLIKCGAGVDTVEIPTAHGEPLSEDDFDPNDDFVDCENFVAAE
ncbi:MAG: hypothetical protein GEU93_05205 [Propionibacteriales bacterium]|nr:hypothetical protein [Propionibacteriales bacterium]